MINKTITQTKAKDFILRNAISADTGRLLKLYDLIRALYDLWGVNNEPDIEMSVKIGKDKIHYNRYAIPVLGTPWVTLKMIEKILEGVEAPPQLLEVIQKRHTGRIRLIVGYDQDSGGKRVYFHEGDQAYGYEFKDHLNFYTKRYLLIEKADYHRVVEHFKQLGLKKMLIETLLDISPSENWSQICARTNPQVNKENVMGYHISSSPKIRLNETKDKLSKLPGLINTGLSDKDFDLWLKKNEHSYLSWLGIATDKNNQAEVTLYIRPDANEWDDRYRPNDFISFFGQEIMNM